MGAGGGEGKGGMEEGEGEGEGRRRATCQDGGTESSTVSAEGADMLDR